tara:strand:- start:117 stop:377 length:261 start_codon:yes stop_codon:yes gene_type:complete
LPENFFLKNSFLLSNPQYPFDKDTPDTFVFLQAGVAKLVDAPDLGSGAARRGGSSPSTRTNLIPLTKELLLSKHLTTLSKSQLVLL